MTRIRRWLFGGFALTACWAQPPGDTGRRPATVFIEERAKGNRNVTLELTRDITKSCPSVVSITENAGTAEYKLAPVSSASTLYRSDGTVEHIFSARWTVSGLTKEVCAYLQTAPPRVTGAANASNGAEDREAPHERASPQDERAAAPQLTPACPIAITRIHPHWIIGQGDPWGSYLLIQFTNTSPKIIAAVRFGVAFVDALADTHESVYNYDSDSAVKPGKSSHPSWDDGVYAGAPGHKVGAIVWVQKLRFADGTFFVDDGRRSCGSHTD